MAREGKASPQVGEQDAETEEEEMKAKLLAEILLMSPEAEVVAYDADAEGFFPVTGVLNDSEEKTLRLCTDGD